MRELCFITIARIFNVGGFIIYEFCKLRGIPYRKDRWGRGFVMRSDFDLNDFAAYVASQDRSYRGEVNKMDHLFRDKELHMRRKKCESDIRRKYLYSPGWNIIRVSLMVGGSCIFFRYNERRNYFFSIGEYSHFDDCDPSKLAENPF